MTFILMILTFIVMYYYMAINKEEEYTSGRCRP